MTFISTYGILNIFKNK